MILLSQLLCHYHAFYLINYDLSVCGTIKIFLWTCYYNIQYPINVNEDYFWKLGDCIDICIDCDKDDNKYYLYFLKNGSKLVDRQKKNRFYHQNSNDNANNQ